MSRKPEADKRRWQAAAICGALALLTLALYWPALSFDFVNYDDGDYVTANDHVQSGLNKESVAWAFTTGHASNWHPLTWLSLELDCQMRGMKPGGMHLTNLLFHIANTMLLFVVLLQMTGAMWRSAVVAALFAWHPTHVESVAWISERKDVLSTFFWLLTMLSYVRYVCESQSENFKGKIYYGLALVLFTLGLMAKPMLVTLPFVLLLLDYWPLQRIAEFGVRSAESKANMSGRITWLKAILEKVPFLVLAAGSSVVTFLVQRKGGSVATLNAVPLGHRMANALVSYLRYAGKLIWPERLSVLYPMPPSWSAVLIAAAGVFVVGASALAVWQMKRRPYLFTGWFWFAGTIVPVIGLVQVGVQSMADRYLYVPAIGLFVAGVWWIAELAAQWPKKREILGAGAAVALAGCCVLTSAQIQYWKNGETLFRHAVAVTSNNYLAYNNLGVFQENHGKPDAALEYYRRSVEINPNYEEARNNLGHILTLQGKYDEALIHLREALRIKPDLVEAHNNLGNALGDMGRMDEAIAQYELSLRYKSDDEDAHNNLGVERAKQGRLDEAEKLLREAVRLKPSDAGAHGNLGNVMALRHKMDEAMREYEAALRINPDDAMTCFNLGNVYLENGKAKEAAEKYEAAIKMRPENADAQYRLGLALAAQGKQDEALAHWREALRLNPNCTDAQRRIDQLQNAKP